MWYDVVDRLDPLETTASLFDFRGAGLSDRPLDGHDLTGYASDLRCAIASIASPIEVVAHSMGAKVAQYVALDPPPNLHRLILIAPGSARAARPNERHRAEADAAFGRRTRIAAFQRTAMVREPSAETMERLIEDALIVQREAWYGWYERGRTADFIDRVPSIRVPTIAVAGDRDPLAPPLRVHHDVVERIPRARLVTFHEIGHNLPVEAPDELAGLLRQIGRVTVPAESHSERSVD